MSTINELRQRIKDRDALVHEHLARTDPNGDGKYVEPPEGWDAYNAQSERLMRDVGYARIEFIAAIEYRLDNGLLVERKPREARRR